jgi:DNA primase
MDLIMHDIILNRAIEKLDLIEFLEEHDVNYTLSGKNIGTNWIGILNCPSCNIGNYHFGINKDNKSFNCFGCGYSGSIVKFVSIIKQTSYKNSIKYIIENAEFDEEDIEIRINNIFQIEETIKKQLNPDKKVKLPESIEISSHMFKKNASLRFFFGDRDLSYNNICDYNLKIGIEGGDRGKIIIPVYFNRKLVAYQTRMLNHKVYKNTGEIKKYLYDYNKIPENSKIIIVEGFFDLVKLNSFIHKIYKNIYYVTTGFSKILTKEQISLLNQKKPKKVIYMFDSDAWFEYNNSNHNLFCESDFIILPTGTDPGSLTEKDFLKIAMENEL